MLRPDDLETGEFVTVLNGSIVPTAITPHGCVGREMHYDLKGIPLAVISVDLPYFLIAIVPSGQLRVMDVREVELKRVDGKYVEDFRIHARQGK